MKSPVKVIDEFYEFIINKDSEAISNTYYPSEDLYVILEGPRLSNRGHANISKGWKDFCESGLSLLSIDYEEGPFVEETAEMAWIGSVIKLTIEVKNKTFTQVFRSTFVLCKLDGEWKIKHEHVSAALEDPYGIGDWLKK